MEVPVTVRIFGLDIGTTSIGFAVINHDRERHHGEILRMGVRIFPEARDPGGTPLNQTRRQKRLVRRQTRRRKQRRRALNEFLAELGLLPGFGTTEWFRVMATDPYALRARGVHAPLEAFELGRAFYHLSKHRHFKGRALEESDNEVEGEADEEKAKGARDETLKVLKDNGLMIGEWLAARDPHERRRRGVHADRSVVEAEFDRLYAVQSPHHPVIRDDRVRSAIRESIFFQRPVFWRKNTLGQCRWMPSADLCPKGSWLSAQRRMLEHLNNLSLAGGNVRPLDPEERAAILAELQTAPHMTWPAVRRTLAPLYVARGEKGLEKRLKFNLEYDGDGKLLGNPVEAKLAEIFGDDWPEHPHKQAIRDAIHERLWEADYERIGEQRVVILPEAERRENRQCAAARFATDFGASPDQVAAIEELALPAGWDAYSTEALRRFLPELGSGTKMGVLINGPEKEDWRARNFPDRDQATGEILDRLPSPSNRDEARRVAAIRNPTVVRVQNELRKVVNNLIDLYGKPDLIRLEVARDVGQSKRQREEKLSHIRANEKRRKEAVKDLATKRIANPSRNDIEKWLLWKECGHFCPYTGQPICFKDLFGHVPRFQVEHIRPRSRSLDNSFANKTLCEIEKNRAKGKRTPYEAFGGDQDWGSMKDRVWTLVNEKRMSKGKARRFCDERPLPEDFTSRQLNDTGYAARQARDFLLRLWPDCGERAPVTVQTVTGRVTAQLRWLWSLNNILAEDGEKTRADHRHHAVDALAVACAHPGVTNQLSRYWQRRDDHVVQRPELEPPWPAIRADVERAVADIVVSHRVRKKVSGPLHKETTFGDTRVDVTKKTGTYRQFVTRKPVASLKKGEIENIRDPKVKRIVKDWIAAHGGNLKKAFSTFPRLSDDGPEIRKVRLLDDRQPDLMVPVATGFADKGLNHHIAIFRTPGGKTVSEVVSLFEAARRLSRREPVINRAPRGDAEFVMSLARGDTIEVPEGANQGYRIVQSIWSPDRVKTLDHADALGSTKWQPKAGSIVKGNAKKLSVDPIGRIRPAND